LKFTVDFIPTVISRNVVARVGQKYTDGTDRDRQYRQYRENKQTCNVTTTTTVTIKKKKHNFHPVIQVVCFKRLKVSLLISEFVE